MQSPPGARTPEQAKVTRLWLYWVLIVRKAGTQRYWVTEYDLQTAAFYTACFTKLLSPQAENATRKNH